MDNQVLCIITSFLTLLAALCTTTHTSVVPFGASRDRTGEYSFAGYSKRNREKFRGVYGQINLCCLENITGEDTSASQVAVERVHNGKYFHLAAGWIVNPKDFHQDSMSLFASYKFGQGHTCYNFQPGCTDFIILTNGSYFAESQTCTSVNNLRNGLDIEITIIRDSTTNNWVLRVYGRKVGYWNTSLKPELHGDADKVAWYGEVFKSIRSRSPVPMGIGQFSNKHPTGYIDFLKYINKENIYKRAYIGLSRYQNKPTVYKVSKLVKNEEGETKFYYGGPGN